MYYLLLAIVLNGFVFVAFRLFAKWNVPVFQAIVVNYMVCVVTGYLFSPFPPSQVFQGPAWLPLALVLGGVFIATFFLMAKGTQWFGLAIASSASKMSLAIPILASLYVLHIPTRALDTVNIIGVLVAFPAIWLTSRRPSGNVASSGSTKLPTWAWAVPVAIFCANGFLDSAMNYSSARLLGPGEAPVFTITIFAAAATIGTLLLLIGRRPFPLKALWGGLFLGIPNFFSVYVILRALDAFENDGAFLFPLLNMGIILISFLAGQLLFREPLSRANKAGIGLALLSIVLLTYKDILWLF